MVSELSAQGPWNTLYGKRMQLKECRSVQTIGFLVYVGINATLNMCLICIIVPFNWDKKILHGL